MTKRIILLSLLCSLIGSGYCEENENLLGSGGDDFLVVVGCGVAGGILGLSTLSFVEEPGDHLNNIVIGGAIGLIVGVAAVAWGQASKSHGQFMDTSAGIDFDTARRYRWHSGQHAALLAKNGYSRPDVFYTLKF